MIEIKRKKSDNNDYVKSGDTEPCATSLTAVSYALAPFVLSADFAAGCNNGLPDSFGRKLADLLEARISAILNAAPVSASADKNSGTLDLFRSKDRVRYFGSYREGFCVPLANHFVSIAPVS